MALASFSRVSTPRVAVQQASACYCWSREVVPGAGVTRRRDTPARVVDSRAWMVMIACHARCVRCPVCGGACRAPARGAGGAACGGVPGGRGAGGGDRAAAGADRGAGAPRGQGLLDVVEASVVGQSV